MIRKIRVIPSVECLKSFPNLKRGYWLKPVGTDKRHNAGLTPQNIRVIPDGLKTPQTWHQDLWVVPVKELKRLLK